jgi:hypothetical protein
MAFLFVVSVQSLNCDYAFYIYIYIYIYISTVFRNATAIRLYEKFAASQCSKFLNMKQINIAVVCDVCCLADKW